MSLSFLDGSKPYIDAISKRSPSVLFMPADVFPHTTGVTMSMAANPGTFDFPIHKRARIMNEATGVARTIRKIGDSRVSAILLHEVSGASRVPSRTPAKKPVRIRRRERPAAIQKDASVESVTRTLKTVVGAGRISSCPTLRAASSQTAIQKTAAARRRRYLVIFFLSVVVEVVTG